MFAIATVIKRRDGTVEVRNGSLFPLPAELLDRPRTIAYSSIRTQGWGTTEFGYSYFATSNSEGDVYIFPGLILEEMPSPRKKFYGYNVKFSKLQIEHFAKQIVEFFDEVRTQAHSDLNMLVHDLRGLSNAIYNSAKE